MSTPKSQMNFISWREIVPFAVFCHIPFNYYVPKRKGYARILGASS